MSHRQAVRSALRVNEGMGVLFTRLGSRQHPRGAVWAAYVRATRQLRDILASGPGSVGRPARAISSVQVAQAGEVLRQLRLDVALSVQPVLQDAAALGTLQALAQLRAYGLTPPGSAMPPASEAQAGLQAVLATVDLQVAAATALLVTGAQPEMITGTDERQGPLSAAAVISPATLWVGAAALAGWGWAVGLYGGRPGPQPWLKQAVAAIDERTTECCLRVHGQVVPLDGVFHLTGQPRFAEYKEAPPFHWRCRTATALVRPEDAGDGLTQEMVDAARAELLARAATGVRVEIDPASATSRR
ncbi:MAG TPA: hypothetical protein VL334_24300 [Anaerolineae bacterium]|nr:hypothetical protein [Anaerolineae bacterium]